MSEEDFTLDDAARQIYGNSHLVTFNSLSSWGQDEARKIFYQKHGLSYGGSAPPPNVAPPNIEKLARLVEELEVNLGNLLERLIDLEEQVANSDNRPPEYREAGPRFGN